MAEKSRPAAIHGRNNDEFEANETYFVDVWVPDFREEPYGRRGVWVVPWELHSGLEKNENPDESALPPNR